MPTTRNIVLQKPRRRVLSVRVHEKTELRISDGESNPESIKRSTESGRNAHAPASVLRRFLLRRMKTGLRERMYSSEQTNDMNESGSVHWRFFALRTIISPKSQSISSGAPSR